MAISTYKAFLMHGTESSGSISYSKLVNVKAFPNLGGSPEMIETTTLSDKAQTYINGIQQLEALEFTANYDKSDFEALAALDGATEHYAVWLGGTESGGTLIPSGSEGKFEFDGQLSVYVNGGSVNEVVEMTISIAPSTVIEMK